MRTSMRVCATCGTIYADTLATCPACGSGISARAPVDTAAGAPPTHPTSLAPIPDVPDDGRDAPSPLAGSRPIAPWRWGCFGLLIVAFVLFAASSVLLALSPSSLTLPFPLLSPRATSAAPPTWTAIPISPADQTTTAPSETTGIATATATPRAGHGGGAAPTPTPRPKPTATTAKPSPTPTSGSGNA